MASERQGICKESELGHDDEEFEQKTVRFNPKSPNTPLSESTSAAYNDCDDLMHCDMQMIARPMDYDEMQQSEPKLKGTFPLENLKHLYVCKIDENQFDNGQKFYSEQPLDFSKKAMSSDRSGETPQRIQRIPKRTPIISHRFQENGANTSDSVDDSFGDEVEHVHFEILAPTNYSRTSEEVLPTNAPQNIACEEREGKLQKRKAEMILFHHNPNGDQRNGPRAANFSESEDESNSDFFVRKSRIFERLGENNQLAFSALNTVFAPITAEERNSLWQRGINKRPHLPNGHSENGSNYSMEKKDGFQIHDILKINNSSVRSEGHSQATHQIMDKATLLRKSPKPHFRHFDREDIQPLRPPSRISSGFSMNRRFPVGTNDLSFESSAMFPSYIPLVFPPGPLENFSNSNPPGDVPGYSGLCSYPPGAMLKPPFNPVHSHQYQQVLNIAQNQQKQKNQRPFKSIDSNVLLNHLQIAQPAAVLSLGSSSLPVNSNPSKINYTDGSGTSAMNSSPQSLSPDSAIIVNGSPCNSNESTSQDVNGEPSRKKIRRIPPEERDAKYLEKRMKNNIAAKKSRDERRRKEDILAISCKSYMGETVKLNAEVNLLKECLREKGSKLDMVVANLISFREKCDGRTREVFEETFGFLLSQPS